MTKRPRGNVLDGGSRDKEEAFLQRGAKREFTAMINTDIFTSYI
ncbi:MAG: hypothetical protein SWE60_13665 [Thermodesulfobacteriota bacterium]|nr:hypothetical protein [Thermodesulfobacteriota bacterium]